MYRRGGKVDNRSLWIDACCGGGGANRIFCFGGKGEEFEERGAAPLPKHWGNRGHQSLNKADLFGRWVSPRAVAGKKSKSEHNTGFQMTALGKKRSGKAGNKQGWRDSLNGKTELEENWGKRMSWKWGVRGPKVERVCPGNQMRIGKQQEIHFGLP